MRIMFSMRTMKITKPTKTCPRLLLGPLLTEFIMHLRGFNP